MTSGGLAPWGGLREAKEYSDTAAGRLGRWAFFSNSGRFEIRLLLLDRERRDVLVGRREKWPPL